MSEMFKTKKMKSYVQKASIKISKTEKKFTRFDEDCLLSSIDTKKNGKMNILSGEKVEPKEVCTPKNSTSIVNNNHFNKKSQSKSCVSSSESKHNRSVKRAKKGLDQSKALESVETVNIPPTRKLTTPIFTYSTPSNRRNSNHKPITDPIFKLPFEYGWKRELVYRSTYNKTAINRGNKTADVYYYSPNNRKLRSVREVQEELSLSLYAENLLTLKSFTFLKQPIGMNDNSKELIRQANSKVSKKYSFSGVATRTKKRKTPVQQSNDHKFSDNENKKTSNKVKVFVKNIKRSRSISKEDKNNLETINTSSSTPEIIAENWRTIKYSNVTSNTLPSKSDDVETNSTNNERQNSEMNDALREYSNSMANMQSFSFMVTAMRHVFKYLKTHELLSASQVCTAWNIIAMNRSLWQTVRLKNSMVCNWNKCICAIYDLGSVSLDMKHMSIPTEIEDFKKFWLDFTLALKKARQLKYLELYRCPASVVEDTIYSLPQLKIFKATSIKNPNISGEGENSNKWMTLNLRFLDHMTNLTEIRIKGLTGIQLTHLPSFESLVNLKYLSLTSIKVFPNDICRTLETLSTSLEFLEIGDCDCLFGDFTGVLIRLNNLTSLRLENCFGSFEKVAKEVLSSIRGLDKLKILELINIEFTKNVEDELEKCTNIKALLIIPLYLNRCAATNRHLIDCLIKLDKTLTRLVWGIPHELVRSTKTIINYYQLNQHTLGYNLELSNIKEASNSIPILRITEPRQRPGEESVTDKGKIDILSVPDLRLILDSVMLNGKAKVVKIPFAKTTRVYLLNHFNDL